MFIVNLTKIAVQCLNTKHRKLYLLTCNVVFCQSMCSTNNRYIVSRLMIEYISFDKNDKKTGKIYAKISYHVSNKVKKWPA